MPHCPSCDDDFPEELQACPQCGAKEVVHRCRGCGEDIFGSDACPICGTLRSTVACALHPQERAEWRCVVCGQALCRGCRRGDRRAGRCETHADVTVIQGWAQIYGTTSEFQARLLRENLQAEGIEARIFSQKDNMLSVDLGELSVVRLLVPAWEYEAALQLIHDHTDSEGEVAFACSWCGEVQEVGSTDCGGCGNPLRRSD